MSEQLILTNNNYDNENCSNIRISKGFTTVFPGKKDSDFEKILEDDENQMKKGLTTYEATLALISSIMGCTLVSVPYSITITGYLNGIITNILVLVLLMFATHLYLQAMDIFKIR